MKTVQHGRGERGPKSPVTGELVCGPETLSEEELARNRADMWAGRSDASARRPVLPRALGGPLEGHGRRCSPRPTGADRACTRAATSRASRARRRSRNGWKCTAARTGRRSTPTTASSCRSASSTHFLKGEKNGWDKQPRVHAAGAPSRREIRRAPRERMAARAHAVDAVPSRPAGHAALAPSRSSRRGTVTYDAMGEGVTFSTPPLETGNRDHRPVGAEAVDLLVHRRRGHLRRAARLRSAGQGSRVPGRARSRTRRSRKAGCAPRSASSIPRSRCRTGRTTRTTRSSRSRPARSTRSTSRSGRPASSCRRATASRSRSAARTTSRKARRRCSPT